MKGNRQQFYALCPSDRSGFFACFSFQMVWLNFEGPERQAEGERYKSFNNLFKRPEKMQPRGTNSVSPRTRTPLTPAWRTCSGPGPITLVKFLFDGILIFCLDDFLATFTFVGLWRFPRRKWNMSKPITKKSKFKYLGRVSSNAHNPCRSEAGAHKHSSACRLVMSLFDGEAICGSPSIRYRSNLTLDCLYSGGLGGNVLLKFNTRSFLFFSSRSPRPLLPRWHKGVLIRLPVQGGIGGGDWDAMREK